MDLKWRAHPLAHGGPLRLIVPGYFGCNQIKYIKRLAATKAQSSAKIQRSGYRFRPIGQKGSVQQPSMWRMPVKSWLVGTRSKADSTQTELYGVAFSGERGVKTIEYSVNGEEWMPAQFTGSDLGPNAWRTFSIQIETSTVKRVFTRATDTAGAMQPESRVENERGYGNNAWRDHAFPLNITKQNAREVDQRRPTLTQTEMARGKKLFNDTATPPCGVCHTLQSAESVGKIGPNLDQLRPTAGRIERAIENGVGAMPAYGGKLHPTKLSCSLICE